MYSHKIIQNRKKWYMKLDGIVLCLIAHFVVWLHERSQTFLLHNIRDREVACSASDRQCLNFGFCVCRAVSSHSPHHPQEVLLTQFSPHVHTGDLKPYSFQFLHKLNWACKDGPCRCHILQCHKSTTRAMTVWYRPNSDWLLPHIIYTTCCVKSNYILDVW